jgi:hypothetical protein
MLIVSVDKKLKSVGLDLFRIILKILHFWLAVALYVSDVFIFIVCNLALVFIYFISRPDTFLSQSPLISNPGHILDSSIVYNFT